MLRIESGIERQYVVCNKTFSETSKLKFVRKTVIGEYGRHRVVAQGLEQEGVHPEGIDAERMHSAGEWMRARSLAGAALHAARAIPAWQRRTEGELRWPVALTTAVAIGLQVAVPDRLVLVHPSWVLPAVQGALLIMLVMANPHRIDRESKALRLLASCSPRCSAWPTGGRWRRLAIGITQGTTGTTPASLLITGAMIWLTNVIVFGLWYWEFDRGGPVARALNVKRYPDFQFVQMVSPPEMVPPDWEPKFVDYLYLAFTNAAAFSPTDVMPLSRWAKVAMAAQSLVSIVTVALVVSRAVNILPFRHAAPAPSSPPPAPVARSPPGVCADQMLRRNVQDMFLPTSLVGSYPQPDWLIDRARLAGRFPPRVRARELWRVDPEFLDQAQDDATLLAIRAQEDAGLDIITDGEIRRESYSNRFATALDGVDIDNPGTALDRSGHPNPVPRVVGPIKRRHPVEVADLEFLRAHTSRTIKITVPGPFTMAQQAQDDHYGSREALALGYAEAVNEEISDLFAAGADIVQLDEPYLQARAAEAAQYGVKVINRALDGVTGLGTTALHLCFGYAAIIHERPARVLVPARARGVRRRADLDRDRAVRPRLLGARRALPARRSSSA